MNNRTKQTILINGEAYDWASVTVSIGTSVIFGVTSLKFDEKQDIKPIYNDNVFPIGYGLGKTTTTVSMTLELEEYRILTMATNEHSVFNATPFPITITFFNEDTLDNLPFMYFINNCKILSVSQDFSQNDASSYVTLNMVASHITKQTSITPDKIQNILTDKNIIH